MEPNARCSAGHHHWLIDEANGEQSAGRCKHCFARRDFRNWLPGLNFAGKDESRAVGASGSYGGRNSPWRQ